MQIKPRFKEFKVKRTPYKKDDRGVMYGLVRYKGVLKDGKKVKGVAILSDNTTNFSNKATARESKMYWNRTPVNLYNNNEYTPDVVGKYIVYQQYVGATDLIENGFSTLPHLVKVSLIKRLYEQLHSKYIKKQRLARDREDV